MNIEHIAQRKRTMSDTVEQYHINQVDSPFHRNHHVGLSEPLMNKSISRRVSSRLKALFFYDDDVESDK